MSEYIARRDLDKRVIRTKKAIKSALFQLMEKKDISSITISELTESANVNRRTFYTHYRSITDILDEIETDLVSALTELMQGFDVNEYRTSAYNLFMGIDDLITGEFDYYFHVVRVDMRGMLMSRLKSVIKETTDKLLSKICNKSDDGLVSAFVVGGFFNTYLEWHIHPQSMTLEEAAELASTMAALCIEKATLRK